MALALVRVLLQHDAPKGQKGNTMNCFLRSMLKVAGFALCASLLLAPDAMAYKRKSSVAGQGGRSVTQEVDANRTATGYNRSSTTTGPNDKSVNTQSSGNWDKNTNTWTKDKAVTGPQGQTKTWQKSTTVTK